MSCFSRLRSDSQWGRERIVQIGGGGEKRRRGSFDFSGERGDMPLVWERVEEASEGGGGSGKRASSSGALPAMKFRREEGEKSPKESE